MSCDVLVSQQTIPRLETPQDFQTPGQGEDEDELPLLVFALFDLKGELKVAGGSFGVDNFFGSFATMLHVVSPEPVEEVEQGPNFF